MHADTILSIDRRPKTFSDCLAMSDQSTSELERVASEEHASSIWRELIEFVWLNKSWWLIPILLVLAALGVFIALSGTAAAPFIYTLF